MIILSILCATTPDRAPMFDKIHGELLKQVDYMHRVHPTLGEIEIIIDDSKRFLDGGLSIGKKYEGLVQQAKGRYCARLDSDDHISPDYLETLVRLCVQNKDVCTFQSFVRTDVYWSLVNMSLLCEHNPGTKPGIVFRKPWPICPVRTEYAKRYEFEDINYGEDWMWFEQVLKDCKTEAHSDSIIHEYHHGSHSEADEIIKSISHLIK